MSGYDDPTPPSEFKIWPGYSSSEDAIRRIPESGEPTTGTDRLIDLLISGELASMLLDRNGDLHPLDASVWGKLLRADARKILWQQDTSKVNTLSMRNSSLLRSLRRDCRPVFLTKELDEKLPRKAKMTDTIEDTVASGSSEQIPKPKGRRPNAGIDDFWIEAAGLACEGKQGRPNQTQKEFIAAMVEWCSTKMGTPYSEDTVTEKIEKLWRRWKLGE